MHTKRHGRSKSRKPLQENATKSDVGKKEVEKIIFDYAKQGMSPAMIGEKLKKEHNVPYIKHHMGVRLGKILKDGGHAGSIPPDLMDLMKKAVNLDSHIQRNRQDLHNAMRLRRIESKIRRLAKYYTGRKALPADWRYDPEQAKLIIKGT